MNYNNRTRQLMIMLCLCISCSAMSQSLAPDPAMDQAPATNRSDRLADFHKAIAEIESQHGAWGAGLSEQLGGLGRRYQERGQHSEAIAVLERAVHVDRINNGLYSLSQVPLVEQMVESLSARGDWQAVHERNQYLYWLHQRNYQDNDPRILPVLDKLGSTYLNDYAMNPANRNPDLLVDAHQLFSQAADVIRHNYGEEDLRLVEPLRNLALTNWFLAKYKVQITSQLESQHSIASIGPELDRQRFASVSSGQLGADQGGVYFPEPEIPAKLSRYLRTSTSSGTQALNDIVDLYEKNPEAPAAAVAQAKAELADWQLLLGRYDLARNYYHDAYQTLESATDSTQIDLFSRPTTIPTMALVPIRSEQPQEPPLQPAVDTADKPEPQPYVLVEFDVDPQGRARNIHILEAQPADHSGNQQRVRRELDKARFRPQLEDGEPVWSRGLAQKYLFPDH